MKKKNLVQKIEVPEKIKFQIDRDTIILTHNNKEIKKKLQYPGIVIRKENNNLILSSERTSRKEKALINTYRAHIKNIIKGLIEPYVYRLKICSSHFPMSISIDKKHVIIKNFYGEKIPRKAKILDSTDVKIDGDIIIVEGIDKEKVGQTSANIEKATRITNRDRRVFMDGIYIIDKGGKKIG